MIKIEAAARLKSLTTAASADDAGKVVLWIEKALGIKGVASGKAGKREKVTFKAKLGKARLNLVVEMDHKFEPPRLLLTGDLGGGAAWEAEEKTGRQTIMVFKRQLKDHVEDLTADEGDPDLIAGLKKLISAKSKVE